MKNWIVFILILINSSRVSACSGCDMGDEIRFSLLNPAIFSFSSYSSFYYSSYLFRGDEERDEGIASEMNAKLWAKRCHNVPIVNDIINAVYFLKDISDTNRSNTFLKYLYAKKDTGAITYLIFAKRCSPLNGYNDPWEKDEKDSLFPVKFLLEFAEKKIESGIDEDLKCRYAFVAIRLAYYNAEPEWMKKLYEKVFSLRKTKNILDYWAMHYISALEPAAKRNYMASVVFANAPDKRFASHINYNGYDADKYRDFQRDQTKKTLNETMQYAQNNKEKADILILETIGNPGKTLESLQKIYSLNPSAEGLSFLLLREINKMEDWILTPYYTYFDPSVTFEFDYDFSIGFEANEMRQVMAERVVKDRMYAKQALSFVESVKIKKVYNPVLWKLAQAYLLFLTEDYSAALRILDKSDFKKNEKAKDFARMLKSLCLIAKQENGKTIVPEYVKEFIMKSEPLNKKFLFAVAKELEFKGNTTDAAALLSKINSRYSYDEMIWSTRQPHEMNYCGWYEYFSYMDAEYTGEQVAALISGIENYARADTFSAWKYSVVENDLPRLYDLLGTKYIRRNDLNRAGVAFSKVDTSLWNQFPYGTYLDANPFYTNFYNEHSKTIGDTIRYDKATITKMLIDYLAKAEDTKNTDRDYYYFLVANCYLNMTYFGNSWMMRRYYWSGVMPIYNLQDDTEFYTCAFAKQYYLKAMESTTNKKFAALCLRLAGRCEKYRLLYKIDPHGYNWEYQSDEEAFRQNEYYTRLRNEFPEDYEELISNCESFTAYLALRK